jgi:hypothetical protein
MPGKPQPGLPGGKADPVIGRTGRVTGRVAPGTVGEVTLQIRGGSEAFYAYASDPEAIIEKGVKVRVDDHQPPLTVFVSPVEPAPPVPQDTLPPRSLIQDTLPPRSLVQDTLAPIPPHHSYT